MEFHFVKLSHTGAYLSMVDPKSKPRVVCFSQKGTAKSFVQYASEFRARTRIWPSLDMSRETQKLEMGKEVSIPYGTPEQIRRYLEIETYDMESLEKLAIQTNVSFFCIVEFGVTYNNNDSETMNFSGQEFNGEANFKDYGDWMDISLETK